MTIAVGEKLPEATLLRIGENGPESVELSEFTQGRKVVIFGLPGAFTPTCSSAHLPSFIRTADALREKGVDNIICVSVNDPHVMKAWGEASGSDEAGIAMLADAGSEFTTAIGMNFTAPPVGFYDRSMRYAMVAEDGVVTLFNPEVKRGACELSAGETILDAL